MEEHREPGSLSPPPGSAAKRRRGARTVLIVVLAIVGLGLAGLVMLVYLAFIRGPVGSLSEALAHGRHPSTKTLVVCAGDSLTHASLSADYVALLRERHRDEGYEFVNAGLNGDTSEGLLQRIDKIVALRPDRVTILIGTNDAREQGGAPPTLDAYRANLRAILAHLREHTHADLAVLSLPPLGEAVESDTNQVVARYREVLAEIAREAGAAYLPLGERLSELILAQAGPDHDGRPFRLEPGLLMGTAFRRFVLRQTWDQITREHGLIVLTDRIHLNDRSAGVAADLIGDWLQASLPMTNKKPGACTLKAPGGESGLSERRPFSPEPRAPAARRWW